MSRRLLPKRIDYYKWRMSGKGVIESRINLFNPSNRKYTLDDLEEIIKNKSFMVFHLTGNTDKLRELVGGNLITEKHKIKDDLTVGFNWYNMPEYIADEKLNYPVAYVGYLSNDDKITLFRMLGIPYVENQRFVHYPNKIINNGFKYEIKITKKINPKYPIYVISKGRWKLKTGTAQALDKMGCPYKIVVEPDEYDNYSEVIDKKNIIKAPENYSERKQGGIPVRNFVWEHAVKSGAKKHWIIDDNIDGFYRWNISHRFKINSGVLFKLIEDYVDRYTNILQAGMNYRMFYPSRQPKPPITFNTRIYSCILIDHRLDKVLKERWRGKYNEDTDLSLRILKAGKGTALFNAFLCGKPATLTTKGGNTDTIYEEGAKDKLTNKAESLVKQHPDVASIVQRYKRGVHHEVNYNKFSNIDLGYKNPKIYKGVNDYNMKLIKV